MKNKRSFFQKIILYTAILSIAAPVIVLLLWSFASRWAWPKLLPEGFSLRAFDELFGPHSPVMPVLLSSMGISLGVAVLSAAIGTITARAIALYDFWGKELVSFGSILPIIVPGTAFAMGIHVVFIRLGLADTVLGVMLVHIIYALPYTVNIMLDVTRSVGDTHEVQSRVLGVSPSRTFIHVSLPQLMPGIMSSISMAYIISFSQYFLTLMIGGGSVKTFAVMMVPFIQSGDRTISSAYSLLFLASTAAVFIMIEALIKRFAFWRDKTE